MLLHWMFTGFADAEELICIPSNNTTGQATPAPLHDTTQCLELSIHECRLQSVAEHTNGSARRSSCARLSPRNCRVPSYDALKKLRTKLREALVSEVGRKGRSMKGMSTAVVS